MKEKPQWSLRAFLGFPFPLAFNFIASFVSVAGLYLVWSAVVPEAALVFSWIPVFGFASFVVFLFIFALAKEVKREQAGAKARNVLISVAALWAALNYTFGGNPAAFSLLGVYLLLFYHSFFFPSWEKRPLLAKGIESCAMFLAGFYVLSLFSADQHVEIFSVKNLLLAFAFWASVFGVETSEDIRSPDSDLDFSGDRGLLGAPGAALAPLASLLVQLSVLINLFSPLFYGELFVAGATTIYGVYFLVAAHFMLKQRPNGLTLQRATGACVLFTGVLALAVAGAHIIRQ